MPWPIGSSASWIEAARIDDGDVTAVDVGVRVVAVPRHAR